MPSRYAAMATRAAATIARNGADVTFLVAVPASASDYDALGNTWTPSTNAGSGITVKAIQDDSDPNRFLALGLAMVNSITLLVAAKELPIRLTPGMQFRWADGLLYTIRFAEPVAPDGIAILWDISGEGGAVPPAS